MASAQQQDKGIASALSAMLMPDFWADAQVHAQARVEAALQRILTGEALPRREAGLA